MTKYEYMNLKVGDFVKVRDLPCHQATTGQHENHTFVLVELYTDNQNAHEFKCICGLISDGAICNKGIIGLASEEETALLRLKS